MKYDNYKVFLHAFPELSVFPVLGLEFHQGLETENTAASIADRTDAWTDKPTRCFLNMNAHV